jgi:hypothetical protein
VCYHGCVKDPARWLLGATGFGTLGTGIVATFMHEAAAAETALIVSGIGATTIALLLPKLKHFKFTKDGVEADLLTSEDDIDKGHIVSAERSVKAAAGLRGSGHLGIGVQVSEQGIAIPANIQMTSEATGALTRLKSGDLADVREALTTLDGNDPRAIQGGSGGKSYFVRFIRDDLRIYYRLLEAPDEWVVVAIKTDWESPPGRPPTASA